MKTKILSLFAGIFVILLAAIYIIFFVGSQIFHDFSFKLPFTRSATSAQNTVTSSETGLVQGSTIVNSNENSRDSKIYNSSLGFNINYPKNWGLLTCSNSYNFELDPVNSTDLLNVLCDFATKPVTVVISNDINGCEGENIKIENIDVLKSQRTTQNYITYQWCTVTQPSFIISNRTSTTTNFAATTTNYSTEIETILGSLQFTPR